MWSGSGPPHTQGSLHPPWRARLTPHSSRNRLTDPVTGIVTASPCRPCNSPTRGMAIRATANQILSPSQELAPTTQVFSRARVLVLQQWALVSWATSSCTGRGRGEECPLYPSTTDDDHQSPWKQTNDWTFSPPPTTTTKQQQPPPATTSVVCRVCVCDPPRLNIM